MFTTEIFVDWLDAFMPEWFALVSGIFLGIFGILALSFVGVVFAPDKLVALMPWIAGFCGISSGYKFMEKRQGEKNGVQLSLCLFCGAATAVAAGAVQVAVNRQLFAADTPMTLLGVFLAVAVFGAGIGRWLRVRYEALPAR